MSWESFLHDLVYRHTTSQQASFQVQLCLHRWRRRAKFIVKVLVNGDNRLHAIEATETLLRALLHTTTPAETYRWIAFTAKHVCDGRCEYV